MKTQVKLFFLTFFLYNLLFFVSFTIASAQTTQQYITVTPSIIHIDLAKHSPDAELTYTNTTNQTVELHLSVTDFKPLEDRLQFLEGKDVNNYKYSLSSWVHFETNDITLNPNESKTVKIFIDTDKLTTGGHYGTIQAEWSRGKDQSPIPTNVILSSLLFVRTNHGNEVEEANINEFQPDQDFYQFPENVVVKIENTGNVDINPHGLVEIKDMFNRTVATGIINENSLLTLPESIRRYDVTLKNQQTFLFPGIYHANMYVHFGKKDITLRKSLTFFSQGSTNIVPYALLSLTIIIIGSFVVIKRRNLSFRA